MKPTYGRVSTRGVIPLSWSLDHIGPICRSVTDSALLLEGLAGYDPLDPASADHPVEKYSSTMNLRTASLKIGIVRRPYFDQLDKDIEQAVSASIEVIGKITSGVRETELPYSRALMTILPAEAYAYHAPWFTRTPELYQPLTRGRLQRAASISVSEYVNARRELDRLRRQADAAFAGVDLLITPTTVVPPIPIEDGNAEQPLPPEGTPFEFRNTHMFNVLGLPAISVPCGMTRDGLPIGMQIAGPRFAEARVLALAHAYERLTDWHTRQPSI